MGPWNNTLKYEVKDLGQACYKGDIDTLELMLFSGDLEHKFKFEDINLHVEDMTPLMLAAQRGQIEAVEMMIKARADPHMRQRMPYGKESSDGLNAREFAAKNGFDDIVEILEKAEQEIKPHMYQRYGKDNNSRLRIYESGMTEAGKDPFEAVKRNRLQELEDAQAAAAQAKPQLSLPAPPPVPSAVSALVQESQKRPKVEATTIALMFPGQGSQYVKMLTGLKDDLAVREMCATATAVLGYDLLEVCLNGPEEKLEETSVCQPAMFLGGMAGLEKLRATRPDAVERPGAVAGLSLGEYTALCAAGVFTFEEGMELVRVRGAAMAEAAKLRPQAMLSVAGLEQSVLEALCAEQNVDGEVCQIANVLFPKGFACAGTQSAINKLMESAQKAGAMQAKLLKTSGGFHTELMKPAQLKLEEALEKLLPNMKPPKCDVYMNVTGKKIKAGTNPAEIVPLLGRQLCSPVLWEPSVRLMIKDGLTEFYEVGPMKQLKAMMKRIDNSTWSATTNVDV